MYNCVIMAKVRLQALVTPEINKQVEDLAKKENRAVANMAAVLIEIGLIGAEVVLENKTDEPTQS